MKNLVLLLSSLLFSCVALGQKSAVMPFGQIDTADLRMTSCDFEKGATAEVLFDKAENYASADSVVMIRHKRIKLFKGYNKDLTTIKLDYYSYRGFEKISDISAETITLENNTIVITKVDPKLIYTQVVDKSKSTVVFVFPEVKEGSVIEYRYKWKTPTSENFPPWTFQATIPTRYSELEARMFDEVRYNTISKGYQRFFIDTNEIAFNRKGVAKGRKFTWAKANVRSAIEEPFISLSNANYQYMAFQLHSVNHGYATQEAYGDQWFKVVRGVLNDVDFGEQLEVALSKEDVLVDHANTLNSEDEKIAYLFNEVKNSMKWNKTDAWYTVDGVHKAWAKKTGNSTEINLILYNILKRAGVDAYPMLISTRDNGTIYANFASFSTIDKAVAFVPVDSTHYYVLDASSKYNVYNEVPADMVNTLGLELDKQKLIFGYKMISLKNNKPAMQAIAIDGEISSDSKLKGSVSTTNYSYHRAHCQSLYDRLGEDKYKESLTKDDDKLKVSNLRFENMQTDSLPLVEKFEFTKELSGGDGKYIYLTPNQFGPLKTNPFLSEERFSDIDFNNCNYYTINGSYKIPTGYKVDAMPKSIALNMADKSIMFKRIVAESEGKLLVNFIISFRRALFTVEEYKGLHDFYKKMFEMMNEPVVLKKSS